MLQFLRILGQQSGGNLPIAKLKTMQIPGGGGGGVKKREDQSAIFKHNSLKLHFFMWLTVRYEPESLEVHKRDNFFRFDFEFFTFYG